MTIPVAAASTNPESAPWIAALDPAVATLGEIDALAGLARELFAGEPAGAPAWIVSHWVDHDPAVGGAHLALSFAFAVDPARRAEPGAEHLWTALAGVAEAAAGQDFVYGAGDELGRAVPGRSGGLPRLAVSAGTCLGVHAARSSGRAIHFPGAEGVHGTLTVAELLAGTAIDEVAGLGTAPVEDDTLVHTFGFLRPVFRAGALVLPVVPFGDGGVTPYEVRTPTPCCAAH